MACSDTWSVYNFLGYHGEGFLALQYYLGFSIILNKMKYSMKETEDWLDMPHLEQWLVQNNYPVINMRRFPHSKWYKDDFVEGIKLLMGLVILFSFIHPFVNTVKVITAEKENQLKVYI